MPWPDPERQRAPYKRSVGVCYGELHKMSEGERITQLFMDFHTLVVRGGIDP